MDISTNETGAEMDNSATLLVATERLMAAERRVRMAEVHVGALVPGAPLRYGVEATLRLRAADGELEVARIAFDAAQDLPAPKA